jgi:hypothetical protein
MAVGLSMLWALLYPSLTVGKYGCGLTGFSAVPIAAAALYVGYEFVLSPTAIVSNVAELFIAFYRSRRC